MKRKKIQMEQWAGFENNDFSGKHSRHGEHVDCASGNCSRPSEQLFVQDEGKKSGWSALIKACPSTLRARRTGRFSSPRLSWRH